MTRSSTFTESWKGERIRLRYRNGKEGEGETVQQVGRIRATGREERAYFFLEVFSQFNLNNVRQQSYLKKNSTTIFLACLSDLEGMM